jgi:hypothetical protein
VLRTERPGLGATDFVVDLSDEGDEEVSGVKSKIEGRGACGIDRKLDFILAGLSGAMDRRGGVDVDFRP